LGYLLHVGNSSAFGEDGGRHSSLAGQVRVVEIKFRIDGNTSLHSAAALGDVETVRVLVKAGAILMHELQVASHRCIRQAVWGT
jgi:hypothetical protein